MSNLTSLACGLYKLFWKIGGDCLEVKVFQVLNEVPAFSEYQEKFRLLLLEPAPPCVNRKNKLRHECERVRTCKRKEIAWNIGMEGREGRGEDKALKAKAP